MARSALVSKAVSIPPFSGRHCRLAPRAGVRAPLSWLRLGDVSPRGWILAQMDTDLRDGLIGHLDRLVPEIMADDIYGRDRRGSASARTVDGAIADVETTQFRWWSSETQSNWWDGFIRHAVLTCNTEAMDRARQYIAEKIATQDDDGYLGIYSRATRYRHSGENGELWAQTTLLRAMLGWYEATADSAVLAAVERAVGCTMVAFPLNKSEPFKVETQFAGVNHGLMFVDVLDRLAQLTGRQAYLDYAVFLYRDFNRRAMVEADVQIRNLLDPSYRFVGHAVHTCEHIRALTIAAASSAEPTLWKALAGCIEKLCPILSPSGGPIGDEWIHGRVADADAAGYEYCSIHELVDSYGVLLQRTGQTIWADALEWLLFNAGQGARHPEEPSIAYCKSDNSLHMLGSIDGKPTIKNGRPETRFKYSPCHQDIAVCCAPNAGRIYPYAIRAMWLRRPQGLAVALYGPCELQTDWDGQPIRITQQTNYPFEFTSTFRLELSQPASFEIAFRQPAWANAMVIDDAPAHVGRDGFAVVRRRWSNGDVIRIAFTAAPQVHQDAQGRSFVSYGPLVFALPLHGEPLPGDEYPLAGFRDLRIRNAVDRRLQLTLPPRPQFEIVDQGENAPTWRRLTLATTMLDRASGAHVAVVLEPMGGTTLRKVCFGAAPA